MKHLILFVFLNVVSLFGIAFGQNRLSDTLLTKDNGFQNIAEQYTIVDFSREGKYRFLTKSMASGLDLFYIQTDDVCEPEFLLNGRKVELLLPINESLFSITDDVLTTSGGDREAPFLKRYCIEGFELEFYSLLTLGYGGYARTLNKENCFISSFAGEGGGVNPATMYNFSFLQTGVILPSSGNLMTQIVHSDLDFLYVYEPGDYYDSTDFFRKLDYSGKLHHKLLLPKNTNTHQIYSNDDNLLVWGFNSNPRYFSYRIFDKNVGLKCEYRDTVGLRPRALVVSNELTYTYQLNKISCRSFSTGEIIWRTKELIPNFEYDRKHIDYINMIVDKEKNELITVNGILSFKDHSVVNAYNNYIRFYDLDNGNIIYERALPNTENVLSINRATSGYQLNSGDDWYLFRRE
ncbi:MAG: hypothetical protein HRT71_01135 [Flavobacteriales bacterium]|nr:hypothetical protein [Flavobacteriales bacterium]